MNSRRRIAAGSRSYRQAAVAALIVTLLAGTAAADPLTWRFYADSRYGQLHVHAARPAGRAASPPLVLFHQTPLSARMYSTILPLLAERRVVYAVDTPGYGESDPPPAPVAIEDYAAAVGDFLDTLPPAVDVLGYHTGVLIATELALTRPEQVRRVVLVAVPLFDAEQRAAYQARETEYAEDGSHLLDMWNSTLKVRPEGQTLAQAARIVAEKQRAGLRAWWAGPAIFGYDLETALPRLTQPVLVMRPNDGLWEHTGKAAALIGRVTLDERPDWAYGLFDAHAGDIAAAVLTFIDGADEPGQEQ
ncbi:MAG: alpha/beta fold hydrolase [Pseudomonadota bacterium]